MGMTGCGERFLIHNDLRLVFLVLSFRGSVSSLPNLHTMVFTLNTLRMFHLSSQASSRNFNNNNNAE